MKEGVATWGIRLGAVGIGCGERPEAFESRLEIASELERIEALVQGFQLSAGRGGQHAGGAEATGRPEIGRRHRRTPQDRPQPGPEERGVIPSRQKTRSSLASLHEMSTAYDATDSSAAIYHHRGLISSIASFSLPSPRRALTRSSCASA